MVLTSVLKNIDVAVFNTIKAMADGKFTGGTYLCTLADGGVDLAPFHDFDSKVPADSEGRVGPDQGRTVDRRARSSDRRRPEGEVTGPF